MTYAMAAPESLDHAISSPGLDRKQPSNAIRTFGLSPITELHDLHA